MRSVPAGDRDIGAVSEQRTRNGEANATRAAGDQRDPSGQRWGPKRHSLYNSARMREVAIVGAGELGGMIAHLLAREEVAPVVRLIDDRGRVAEGKALDITQS